MIQSKKLCRILETHSPLSALIAEKLLSKRAMEKKLNMMVFGLVLLQTQH